MNKVFIFISIAFFLLSIKSVYSESLSDKLDSICQSLDVNALNAIVVKDTSIIFNYVYGKGVYCENNKVIYRNLKCNDLWRIASETKSIVASAILILRDRGQLDLDADINKYLSENIINPKYSDVPITVKMLLCHKSSIAKGQYVLESYKGIEFNSSKPGTKYEYSNVNYLLLAIIIESVTNERFDEFIQKNIFEPIGVVGYFNPFSCDSSRLVYGKWFDKKSDKLSFCDTYKWYSKKEIENYQLMKSTMFQDPAGGCIISSLDLAKYVMMHANNGLYKDTQILSVQAEKLMRHAGIDNGKYALGTINYSSLINGETLYGHTGYSLGIFSCIMYNPDKNYGFIILCDGAKIAYPIAYDLMHAPLIRLLYESQILE